MMMMGLAKGTAVALLVVLPLLPAILGAVNKVGDSAGWTTIGNIDYKKWSATKTFQIGDTIIFEYNPQFHNVMRVTHTMYRACNTTAPLATYTTGNDSVKITNHGHHFFFCGVPGHCQSGQKVDINVLRSSVDQGDAPAPSVSDQQVPSPSVPSAKVPGASPSNASSLRTSLKGFFGNFALVMTVFAALVSSFVN